MSRDMTLFVDDDGTAYHIYSSEFNSTTHIAKLTDDYLDHTGQYARAFVARWMEAPTLFKHNAPTTLSPPAAPDGPPTPRATPSPTPSSDLGRNSKIPASAPDADITFGGQGTYVLPVFGKSGAFIFMADRWNPENAVDGRYIWLPIEFGPDKTVRIVWKDEWTLDVFEKVHP